MLKRKGAIIMISVALSFLLALQPVAYAGGNSIVNGLIAVVAVVVTGGGWLAAGIVGGAVATQPKNEGGGGGGTTTENIDISKLRVELQAFEWDEALDNPVSITVTIKNTETGSVLVDLPTDCGLYVSHSSTKNQLIEGYSSPNVVSVNSVDSFVSVNNYPQATVAGIPAKINYSIESQCQSVKLDIINSLNSVVYSLAESSPNPAKPLPFIWKGIDKNGINVPSGTYSIRIKAIKPDGAEEYSPIQIMSLGETIPAGEEHQITSFNAGYATVRVWPPTDGTPTSDTVVVKLKYKDAVVSTASKTVDFGGGAPTGPTITQKSLNFSNTIKEYIDGVLVGIDFPCGDLSGSNIIRVTSFMGQVDEIKYEFDAVSGQAKITTKSKTEIYTSSAADPHKRDVYYNILFIMNNLVEEVYSKKGIYYDSKTGKLTFSSALSSKISSVTSGDIFEITVPSGKYNYDVTQNALSTISGSDIASGGYIWDESNNMAFVPDGSVAAGAVKMTAVGAASDNDLVTGVIHLPFSARTFQIRLDIFRGDTPEEIYPMERPQEPSIEAISWVNRNLGIVKIEGMADTYNSKVEVVINGSSKADAISTSGGKWTFTNYSYLLHSGENKINVIATSKNGGGQVESGDVTVYLGDSNKPDLILLEPRDRQVKEDEGINSNSEKSIKTWIKGETVQGASLTVKGISITINNDGTFDLPLDLPIKEGSNTISILVKGSGSLLINKTILGAYKFVNGNRTNAYVLRKGDFIFSKGVGVGGGLLKGGFDWVPFDPDHTGVYSGNGMVTEAKLNEIKTSLMKTNSGWNGDGFHAATQIPILLLDEEQIREKVASIVSSQQTNYDLPFITFFKLSLFGHYDGPDGGFYCSELAWWGWKQQEIDFGIKKKDLLYPPENSFFEGINEDKHTNTSSILPAYLCQKTMKVKEVAK